MPARVFLPLIQLLVFMPGTVVLAYALVPEPPVITSPIEISSYANPHAVTSIGARIFTYDKNGNLISDVGGLTPLTNTWSYRNELIGTEILIPGAEKSIEYGYDIHGIRVFETSHAKGETTIDQFPTPDYALTENPDGSIETTISISIAGMPVASVQTVGTSSPSVYAIHVDHLRSSRLATDEAGALVESTDYNPFGSITEHTQTTPFAERRKYTGHEYDASTNYTYAKARYLETSFGRFLSEEPLFWESPEGLIEDPQLFNTYAYARNNPIKFVDPDGRLVELAARPVALGGQHLFYQITPDNPSQVNISSLAPGTTQFTIGAYNRGSALERRTGIGNKLVPEIGFVDGINNSDTPYLTGEKQITDKITITPPNGQSDSEFINNLGGAFHEVVGEGSIDYFTAGQRGVFGYANSNNFVYELGERVQIADQVSRFNPQGHNFIPGSTRGFPTTSYTQYIAAKISALKAQVTALQQLISANLGN